MTWLDTWLDEPGIGKRCKSSPSQACPRVLGAMDGARVGDEVVGCRVGFREGPRVGFADGRTVGSLVG